MYKQLLKISMLKYIDTTNNYLLKLLKSNDTRTCDDNVNDVSMYTVRVCLAKSEQVFICYNQLNSFSGIDFSWALRFGRKSFIQSDSDIFRFHLLFLKFLAIVLKFS